MFDGRVTGNSVSRWPVELMLEINDMLCSHQRYNRLHEHEKSAFQNLLQKMDDFGSPFDPTASSSGLVWDSEDGVASWDARHFLVRRHAYWRAHSSGNPFAAGGEGAAATRNVRTYHRLASTLSSGLLGARINAWSRRCCGRLLPSRK